MLVKNTSRQSLMLVKAFTLTFLCLLLFTGSQDSTSSAEAALKPINPNASDSSRQLLAFLSDISGEYLITGQHDYLESPDEQKNRLGKISGSMPGLHGYELGAISNQSPTVAASQRKSVIHSAIQWSRSGGIVVMTYHQPLPGTAPTWKNVQRKISQAEFDAYVTPGTPQYQRLIRDLDQVAASLKTLKNADVPVLWRPYHEMNGGWFWWGEKDNFDALWGIMYDRFVNVHQLDNLLWVWNPNAPNAYSLDYEAFFPGTAKVDILAADIYEHDFKQSYYHELLALAGGKPIAIGENGGLPSPEVLKNQPKWVYSMTWGSSLTQDNSTTEIRTYMSQSKTLTLPQLVEKMKQHRESEHKR